MGENINISPFIGTTMTLLFVFSTIYTLAFYYYQGDNKALDADSPIESTSMFAGLDALFNAVSWLSPFGFIKLIISTLLTDVPDFYTILDMLLIRPIGWTVFIIQVNYVISLVPTIGKGE